MFGLESICLTPETYGHTTAYVLIPETYGHTMLLFVSRAILARILAFWALFTGKKIQHTASPLGGNEGGERGSKSDTKTQSSTDLPVSRSRGVVVGRLPFTATFER